MGDVLKVLLFLLAGVALLLLIVPLGYLLVQMSSFLFGGFFVSGEEMLMVLFIIGCIIFIIWCISS